MATYKFEPSKVAEDAIIETGIDVDKVYNDRDGVTRAQLTLLSQASNVIGGQTYEDSDGDKKTTTLKENIYKTIHRLDASANKKNIDFAANVKNTMYNTMQFEVMNQVESDLTPTEKAETMVRWNPSTANEADEFHSLQYGKVMTLSSALEKGLGTRYGCQCSYTIVDGSKEVIDKHKDIASI